MIKQPKSVLFVCLGNTCRSPMAEACFKELIKRKNYQANNTGQQQNVMPQKNNHFPVFQVC